jgi:hypothetical protein
LVLPEGHVGLAQQDEDGFDACSDSLLEAAYFGKLEVDIIINLDSMGRQG